MNAQRLATGRMAAALAGAWLAPVLCGLAGDGPAVGSPGPGGGTGSQPGLDISMSSKFTNALSTNDSAGGSTGPFPVALMVIAGGVVVLGAGGLLWAARGTLLSPAPAEEDPEEKAALRYESAQALLRANRPEEAVSFLETQLETTPDDTRAWLLLAELHALHLHDVSAARDTIARLVRQPGLSIQVVASAQERLAEWHLAQGGTAEEASAILKVIVQRFPTSEYAQAARERIRQLLGELPRDLEWEPTQVNLYRKG